MQSIIEILKKNNNFAVLCEEQLKTAELKTVQKFFIEALEQENIMLATSCLKFLPKINFGSSHCCDSIGNTSNPLIRMAHIGKYQSVKFLVDNGAEIDYISANRTTAIMYAFEMGHIDIVKYLYEKNAKLNVGMRTMVSYGRKEYVDSYMTFLTYLHERLVESKKLNEKQNCQTKQSTETEQDK